MSKYDAFQFTSFWYLEWIRRFAVAYVGPSQICMPEFFCKSCEKLLAINYFLQKASSQNLTCPKNVSEFTVNYPQSSNAA